MGYVVKMPKLGLEMEQGTILEWHIEEGDTVEEGETIAEVESEKSIGEVDAREDGVLRLIELEEGTTVPPGTPIGIVAGADEDIADLETEFETDEESTEAAVSDADESDTESSAESTGEEAETTGDASGTEPSDVKASPRAEQRADELGVDITDVDGSGPQGAITVDDVENAVEASSEEPTPEEAESGTTGPERATAPSVGRYRTTTLVTHDDEAKTLVETTEMAADAFDFDVSTTDMFLLAVSAALDEHPTLNATFEDGTHHLHEHQNVALAVDSDGEIVETVLSTVDGRTFADIVEASHGQMESVADDDSAGKRVTFAVATAEEYNDVRSVVTPPTVAGLLVDCSHRRAIPAENGVRFRRYLRLSLAYDSRAVGDRDVEAFLESLLEYIEELPELVLQTYT